MKVRHLFPKREKTLCEVNQSLKSIDRLLEEQFEVMLPHSLTNEHKNKINSKKRKTKSILLKKLENWFNND